MEVTTENKGVYINMVSPKVVSIVIYIAVGTTLIN